MATRILVTYKGETGYLSGETGLDMRTRWGVTMDERNTSTYTDPARAARIVRKVSHLFESVELEEV